MAVERVLLIRINKDNDPVQLLKEIYRSILIEYYSGDRSMFKVSMDNEDWLWLLDRWASFYLNLRMETKEPELSTRQRLFIRLGLMKKPEKPKTPTVSAVYLKQLRNEMSDKKYLLLNGYKIPVKVT